MQQDGDSVLVARAGIVGWVKNFPKPELIIITALYHDIAKGRGGDHSLLGSADIEDFALRHGLKPQEISLLKWLVENHLLMSSISQREDTSDPDVIHKFAKHVGDLIHLDHLYVLTVADINATKPHLWTDWKGSLMHNLYFETKRVLQLGVGEPTAKSAWLKDAKDRSTDEWYLKITTSKSDAFGRYLADIQRKSITNKSLSKYLIRMGCPKYES